MSGKDRRSLLSALEDHFLSNGYDATNKNLALRILFSRMERMPNEMLLETIRALSEIGAPDMTTLVPGSSTPMDSLHQVLGLLGEGRPASNPFKDTGMLLEALEHVANHFRHKGESG
jgi:hypothetical protein